MDFVYGVLIVLEVIVSIIMIIAILLQPSEQGLVVAFGGGISQSMFGGRGATTFLSKLTGILAAVFFVLSIVIGLISGSNKSVVNEFVKNPPAQHETIPANAGTTSGESQKEQKKSK